MTFTRDKQPTHDRSEAGRKGRSRSPWNRSTTLFKEDRKRRGRIADKGLALQAEEARTE